MGDKLKPCPFCGGQAIVSEAHTVADETLGLCFVFCKSCRAETSLYRIKQEAIKAWNRRVEPVFTPDELDEIKRMFVEHFSRKPNERAIIEKCAKALKGELR